MHSEVWNLGIFAHRMSIFCAPGGKKRISSSIFNVFSQIFFIEFLTFFFDSELSGTIFAELEVLWTIRFFKNFPTPYFRPGQKKIYRIIPDW